MSETNHLLELTGDEALVLFAFLSRFSEEEKLTIEHSSEEQVLWNALCQLEKILAEPFQNNYGELLEQARKRIARNTTSETPDRHF
jgi:hypothetical protein